MNQSQSAPFPTPGYNSRVQHVTQNRMRDLVRLFHPGASKSIAELLQQIEAISTPQQLNKLVNKLQGKLWHLPKEDQTLLRERLADILTVHIQQSTQRALRLEAAGWLRLFVQAAYLSQPELIFVTLVTAATSKGQIDKHERAAYLKMIVDCFWPFRYPYPAYTWEVFPTNRVFFALAPLLAHVDDYMQDTLVALFGELPTLDEEEIITYLLPIALQWAAHPDSDRRSRIASVLARMSNPEALAALQQLQSDQDPVVQAQARRAAEKEQRA